jgi:hypothetical protein
LAGIDVDRMNLGRAVEQVVEGVAAGAGDHHHPAVGAQPEQLPVDVWILPARVVDELTIVDVVKNGVVRGLEKTANPRSRPMSKCCNGC